MNVLVKSLRDKVRKLRTLASGTTNEHEALAATRAADVLEQRLPAAEISAAKPRVRAKKKPSRRAVVPTSYEEAKPRRTSWKTVTYAAHGTRTSKAKEQANADR